ncbi:hypothetical protein ACT3CD_14470 [Geofilum sp. OHC36d9]|uniref:hypothetical protein n=1 Tax=Geofilum sp. OHC36d9 TaxID=3458413 RepID=UPI0040347B03
MTRISKYVFLILLVALSTFIVSCIQTAKKAQPTAAIHEGTIEYSILWPAKIKNESISFFLPKQLTMKFNRNNQAFSLSGAMDLYTINLFRSDKSDTIYTFIDLNVQKQYTMSSAKSLQRWLNPNDDMGIEIDRDTLRYIQEMQCHKAILFNKIEKTTIATIWFTEEIDAGNLNKYTPFKELPGIMMEMIPASGNNNLLGLKAVKISNKAIPENSFIPPIQNYNYISEQEIVNMISNLIISNQQIR